jgi:hypothetical protein
MWADPNLNDFYKRVARIEYTHARGHGFIAEGALSRASFAPRTKHRRTPIVRPLLMIALLGFALKGVIHHQLGTEVYDARVAALLDGQGIDRLGGQLMKADPVTLMVSKQIAAALAPGGMLNVAG